MAKTVVGLFESFAQAQAGVKDLLEAGIDPTRISVVSTPTGTVVDAPERRPRRGGPLRSPRGQGPPQSAHSV